MPETWKDPKVCSAEDCTNSFQAHRWGNSRSQAAGWFHQKNGRSWCPNHIPEWVAEWRARMQDNIHEVR